MKLRHIPFLTNYYITKNGDVYFSEKNSDTIKIQPYFDSYWKIDINKISYRLDYLILSTFIGLIDLPIHYKNARRSISSLIFRLKNGITRNDIASKYDLSKYNNSSHKFKVLTNKDETIIRNLDILGFGPTEISKITGINRTTISSNLRKIKELSA